MRRLAKTSAIAPGWCRITLAPLTPQTDRKGPTTQHPRPCHRRRAPATLTRRSPAMSASPAKDGGDAEVSAAVDARSRPAGGMCGGNCRTQPADGRSPLRETDRPDLARPRRAIRRPYVPTRRRRLDGRIARRAGRLTPRRARSEKRSAFAAPSRRTAHAGGSRACQRPAVCRGRSRDRPRGRFLAEVAQRQPESRPLGSGPDRTVACRRRATRLQGRASLKAAIASPDARTGRNPFLRSRDPVRDPSPRTARLPTGASTETPFYRRPRPPVSRHRRRLDRLTSRPQPTPAAAIARLRIKGNR